MFGRTGLSLAALIGAVRADVLVEQTIDGVNILPNDYYYVSPIYNFSNENKVADIYGDSTGSGPGLPT